MEGIVGAALHGFSLVEFVSFANTYGKELRVILMHFKQMND